MTRLAIPATAFDANVVVGILAGSVTRLDERTRLYRGTRHEVTLVHTVRNPRYDPLDPDGRDRFVDQTLITYRSNGDITVYPPSWLPRHPSITRGAYGRILLVLPPGWSLRRNARRGGYGGAVQLTFGGLVWPFSMRSGEVTFHANCDASLQGYRTSYATLESESAVSDDVAMPVRTRPLHPGWSTPEPRQSAFYAVMDETAVPWVATQQTQRNILTLNIRRNTLALEA